MPTKRTPKASAEVVSVPAPVFPPEPVSAPDPEFENLMEESGIAVTGQEGLTEDTLPLAPDDYDADDDEGDEGDEGVPAAQRLTGEALLEALTIGKAQGQAYSEIASKAGYVTRTANGGQRVMLAQFNAAVLRAEGHDVGTTRGGTGRAHLGLTRARVSGQGTLLVSQLATKNIQASPGDCFDVSYPGQGQILLTPTGVNEPVAPRKPKGESIEQPGTPLFD